MSYLHRNPIRGAGVVLLLAGVSAVHAGQDWNCVRGSDGTGWLCTGRGGATVPTQVLRVTPSRMSTSAPIRAADFEAESRPRIEPIRATARSELDDGALTTAERTAAGLHVQTAVTSVPALPVVPDISAEVSSARAMAAVAEERRPVKETTAVAGGTLPSRGDGPGSRGRTSGPRATSIAADPGDDLDRSVRVDRTTADGPLHEGLEWGYCGLRPARLGPAVSPPQPTTEAPLLLSADAFDYDRELDLLWLSGDVRGTQGNRFLAADKLVYDRNTSDLVAEGDLFLTDPGVRIIADRAQLNLASDRGRLSSVRYRLTGKINARGRADQAELVRSGLVRYRNIAYSTCRPGQRAWSLDAAELELDRTRGQGVARDAKLRGLGLPVFYAPYLSFPIDNRRKSGVLVPAVGNSENNGIDITIPYYWNIAPAMDATLSTRYLSKRGPLFETEFRFLSPRQRVKFSGEVLLQDKQLADRGARWALHMEQKGSFGSRWSTALDYNAVSDSQYFEDFGSRLEQTSRRNIERRGDLIYFGDGWYLRTRLQGFQTLDETLAPEARPYARLPQVLFATDAHHPIGPGIELGASGEYDYFHHETNVYGHRVALQPFARWPLHERYGHLIPQINLYLAAYALENQQPGRATHPAYAIPSFNLDTQLVFERPIKWFGRESLQTMEPRLFYLYTPFRDQDDIPTFDSTELSFRYNSLFRLNRFSGRDRIGDANQLTLGLTSRTFARDSGRELLRASIGRILYFRDREVRISGLPEVASGSSIAGLLKVNFRHDWTGRASFEYDPQRTRGQLRRQTLELRHRGADNRLFNLAYRYARDAGGATRYKDTDLSFSLPVDPRFRFVGRWNYSLLNNQTVEAFAGLEYGRCCWRVRLIGHHLKNEPDNEGTTSFMIQMELAGLGSIGQRVDKFLERDIYGYSVD